jgi:NADH:ubiquinone oxidoreductase subunit 3 (subunit A)
MRAKNQEYLQVEIFVNIYLCIRVLVILYNELLHKYEFGQLLHKYEFGQPHCEELTKRSPTKFSLQFLGISTVFYEL